MLKENLDVIEVDAGVDYRLRTLAQINAFLVPADAAADARMKADFQSMTGNPGKSGEIIIQERSIKVRRRSAEVIWFDFDALCGGPRSQNDYLELARQHHTLFLSNVPRLSREQSSEARRLTWLVDVLYDHRVKLDV